MSGGEEGALGQREESEGRERSTSADRLLQWESFNRLVVGKLEQTKQKTCL